MKKKKHHDMSCPNTVFQSFGLILNVRYFFISSLLGLIHKHPQKNDTDSGEVRILSSDDRKIKESLTE